MCVFIIAAVGGDADAQSASARPECACWRSGTFELDGPDPCRRPFATVASQVSSYLSFTCARRDLNVIHEPRPPMSFFYLQVPGISDTR